MKRRLNTNNHTLRLLIIFIAISVLFFILIAKLYTLQIVQGEFLKNQVLGSILKPVNLEAPRGNIYDKFGRPLAVNESSFTVNIDPSTNINPKITGFSLNDVILKTMNVLQSNNEQIIDEFPISKEKPYTFLFNGSESLEKTWKNDMNLEKNSLDIPLEDITAEQAFNFLKEKFEIDPSLSDEDARKILIVRSELHKRRFSKFIPVTLAYDVSQKTISKIEENSSEFLSIYIDVEGKRVYPAGDSFSHTLGYIRSINPDELKYYQSKGFKEYDNNDIVGKEGIEKAFETTLNGIDGTAYYEVDNLGRKIKKNEDSSEEPIPGDDVFLTLDANLNNVIYNAVETTLSEVIINRLLGKNYNGPNLSSKDIFSSMVKANTLDMKKILASKDNTYSYKLKNYILSKNSNNANDLEESKKILADGIKNNLVSQNAMILALYEQGVIVDNEKYVNRIKSGNLSPLQFLIDKLTSLQITPHMTGMLQAPASASVIVSDIKSGAILSSVSYPSYDNNRFVNNFDNDYYRQLHNDPTSPMNNRPFTEPRAPGSTFKPITAVAALENGIITPRTTIYDKDIFKEAGKPYAQCWIHGSHGNVDVEKSLEVSCNYFYYDISHRMGIQILNKYMEEFGLNQRSGVEIYELYDSSNLKKYPSKISSPEYKRYIESSRNPEAEERDLSWKAGDTIRTSIGQAYNNYTASIIVKYTATLANGGYRYSLHFLDKIADNNGNILEEYEPILEHKINIAPENLKAIHNGMYRVTTGSHGTLTKAFKDFPVKVAAKSGTAQENLKYNNHNVYIGFAPYDDPQIAISVFIPYGDDSYSPAPKITKKILEEYLALNKEPEKKYTNSLTK
ncbi:penicillin-binding transpeptidase domain-containing protein [uncultured Tyzzerella sp.]|uniref:penicillin-binding transpeptidase domain-containing protein n=1 Tax=uncultured Tyzzerella sp. TaxID=2321398 RepID=UPI0029421506|nr:penicillin-binding transpeptidase domain-containing protein [uncultured Tyzzerella sp.]